MAGNYAQLLDIINNPTDHSLPAWDNNAKQIEGETIQQYLLYLVNSLTVGYQFMGVATPSTSPGTPDQNVFYIGGAGTYANFGTSITVRQGQICVFAWNGSWTNTPIEIANSGFVNVNDVNGRSAAYESASAARSVVPTAYRKSGLNITYLLSTGWIIEQFVGDDVEDWTNNDNWRNFSVLNLNNYKIVISPDGYLYEENNKIHFKKVALINIADTTQNHYLTDGTHQSSEDNVIDDAANTMLYLDLPLQVTGSVYVIKVDTFSNLKNRNNILPLYCGTSDSRTVRGGFLFSGSIIKKDMGQEQEREIPIGLEMVPLSKGTGQFVASATFLGRQNYSSTKFTEIPKDGKLQLKTTVVPSVNGVAVVWYDKNYARISATDWINDFVANVAKDISSLIPINAAFFKVILYDGQHDMPTPQVTAIGVFSENPYRFNILPTDVDSTGNGYQTLQIPVNVSNPDSDNAQTATLQDSEHLYSDYGILALPKQYKNSGKPTRLIIYCHGAGVHYTYQSNRFPEGASNFGLEPEYWLSEGYAVMDIEGDPYDDVNKHFYIPQALQCYLNAYHWVVEAYNICTDGIFLGGRSMGASMALEIINNGIIPVIACFPVAGGFNPIAMWNAMGGASYRQFVAEHMGLPNADQVAWTNNNPMSATEFAYLKTNYKILAQFTPVWKMIEQLPDAATMMKDEFNVAYSTASLPAEAAVYDALHLRVGVPFKFFVSPQDTSAVAARSSEYVFNMMRNNGTQCEYRVLPTGGHAFELESQNRLASYTNSYGVTLTDVPIVYIEALQFAKRYELPQ